MKPSSTPRPTRLALTGLSLGASVLLASSLVSCANSSDSVSSQVTPAAEAQDQPNVMMILLDDLGYSDLGPYGGEVTTPHLEALAQDSAQFTDFHTSPCAPPLAQNS